MGCLGNFWLLILLVNPLIDWSIPMYRLFIPFLAVTTVSLSFAVDALIPISVKAQVDPTPSPQNESSGNPTLENKSRPAMEQPADAELTPSSPSTPESLTNQGSTDVPQGEQIQAEEQVSSPSGEPIAPGSSISTEAIERGPQQTARIRLRLLDERLEQLQLQQTGDRQEMSRLLDANQAASEQLQNANLALTREQRLTIQYQIDQRQQQIHTLGQQMDERYADLQSLLETRQTLLEQQAQAQAPPTESTEPERGRRRFLPFRFFPRFGIGISF